MMKRLTHLSTAEFLYYHLPFPDDVYLGFPSCYTLERVIGEPPLLPEFWEVRNGLLLCSEYKETEYITYLIDVNTGQRVGKVIDLLSLKVSISLHRVDEGTMF